jgi:hypothetical protein
MAKKKKAESYSIIGYDSSGNPIKKAVKSILGIGTGKKKRKKKSKKSDNYTIIGYDASGKPIKRKKSKSSWF